MAGHEGHHEKSGLETLFAGMVSIAKKTLLAGGITLAGMALGPIIFAGAGITIPGYIVGAGAAYAAKDAFDKKKSGKGHHKDAHH